MLTKPILMAIAAIAFTAAPAKAGELGVYKSNESGFDTRTYWYDDGHEITVFDTQFLPSMTEAMIGEIRKSSDRPISRIIVTHPNPDKFNGLSILHKLGAVSIASKATAAAMPGVDAYKRNFWVNIAKAFAAETYPQFEPVQQTFSNKMTINLASGETITLIELKHSGVSSTQTVARIDATGDLIVGDLVNHNAHAWLEGGIVAGKPEPDLQEWLAALEELRGLSGRVVHGGRGESAPVEQAVLQQQAYLRGMDALVTQYLLDLGPHLKELADPATAGAHYQVLQQRAAGLFPERELPYLVGFGIYGLVDQKRADAVQDQ